MQDVPRFQPGTSSLTEALAAIEHTDRFPILYFRELIFRKLFPRN